MVLRIPRPIGLTALVCTLFSASAGIGVPAKIARADNCLTAPNSPTPQDSHWYYRMDWPRQRKCWYLRAPGQPPQQAAPQVVPEAASAAPSKLAPALSVTPGDDASPSTHVKMLSVKPQPAPMTSATAAEPVRQSAWEGNAAPSQGPAPPANLPQPGVQTLAPAAPAGAVWPDPPPVIAATAATNAVAVSDGAGAGPIGRKDDALMSEDSQSAARHAASPMTAMPPAPVTATLVEMLLALGLGLAAAGILSRIVMKFAAARREPIITDYAELDWVDDNTLQPEFLDDRGDRGFTAHSDPRTDLRSERSQPPAASSRRRSPAAPASPSATAEDLEATERVIMGVLHRTRA
jgi:hypothetical protein